MLVLHNLRRHIETLHRLDACNSAHGLRKSGFYSFHPLKIYLYEAALLILFPKEPQDLQVSEIADPVPEPHEYLIAIKASAANFFDLLQIRGRYQHQPPFPWISGSEFSGIVLKTPSAPAKGRTLRYAVGDRVFGAGQGSYATKIAVPEDSLRLVPDGWSFSEAAGLFVTAPTSYAGLVIRAQIRNGA